MTTDSIREACERLNHEGPDFDPVLQAAQGLCFAMRALVQGHGRKNKQTDAWLADLAKSVTEQTRAVVEKIGPAQHDLAVPRVSPDALTTLTGRAYLAAPVPLILEGAAQGTKAVQTWTPALFGERYGNQVCILAKGPEQRKGTLSEVWDAIKTNEFEGWYAHNISDIFHAAPELVDDLGLKPICKKLGEGHFITQLFLGGHGTKTAYHCASHLNVFVNVFGEKEWNFAHPRHWPLLYGTLHSSGIYAKTSVDFTKTAAEQAEEFPLYGYSPTYKAVLKPGDVLLVPPWWWHAVKNLSSATIACATRHALAALGNQNTLYETTSAFMPHVMELTAMAMKDRNFKLTDAHLRDKYEY